jgi:hypothetical protein
MVWRGIVIDAGEHNHRQIDGQPSERASMGKKGKNIAITFIKSYREMY